MKIKILFTIAMLICVDAVNDAIAAPINQGLVFHVDAADPLGNGGTSLPTSGAALPTWSNLGSYGSAANATSSGTSQPFWFNSGGAAGAPRINFDGVNDRYTAGTAADWKFLNHVDNVTFVGSSVYVIYRSTDADPNTLIPLISTGGVSGSQRGYDLFVDDRNSLGNERLRMIVSSGSGSHVDITGNTNVFPMQTWNLVTSTYGLIAGDDASLRVNGGEVNSKESGNLPTSNLNPINPLNIGRVSNNTSFNNKGDFSEILIYNQRHATVERTLVENYLSAKYSGTSATPEMVITNDRYAGDTLANGNFDQDVFGIGREADGTVSSGVSGTGLNISEVSGSLDINGEYVLAGHKQPGTVSFVTEASGESQLNREWYIDATTLGTIEADLTFDFDDMGLTLDSSDAYRLLYKADDATSFSVFSNSPTFGANEVSFSYLFNGANDGIFTLGIAAPIPEPSTLLLLGLGAVGLSMRRRRNR